MLEKIPTSWKLFVLLLFIVTAVELVIYFKINSYKLPVRDNISSTRSFVLPSVTSSSVSTIPVYFKILYQAADDIEDRTLIYDSGNEYNYNGVGSRSFKDGYPYIVGVFSGKQAVAGSKDSLWKLSNPVVSKPIGNVRIVAEKSPAGKPTRLSVENIFWAKTNAAEKKSAEDFHFLKNIGGMTESEQSTLVKIGDALIVVPATENISGVWAVKKDGNGNILAATVFIRRTQGSAGLAGTK